MVEAEEVEVLVVVALEFLEYILELMVEEVVVLEVVVFGVEDGEVEEAGVEEVVVEGAEVEEVVVEMVVKVEVLGEEAVVVVGMEFYPQRNLKEILGAQVQILMVEE